MTTLRLQLLQFAIICLFMLISVEAMGHHLPRSNACQTKDYGIICYIENAGEIGSECRCGRDPGSFVAIPQSHLSSQISDKCATIYGVCRVVGPVGSNCYCDSDPGRITE